MEQAIVKAVREYGIALVESQHQFFLDETADNSEHVPAIKRIADTSYRYLKANGINSKICREVRKALINRGRELFIDEWMHQVDEDEEPSDRKEQQEARRTFDELLKGE